MYSSHKRQFVLKESSGRLWNLFYDEKLGLCYSILTKRNTWTNPVSLQRDVLQQFYADIDANDRIHILLQDPIGNILYSRIEHGSLKTQTVLTSKSPTPYDKNLRLIFHGNTVHFFYCLKHAESWILAHQTLMDDRAGAPKVIDYIQNNSCPYSVLADKSDNIYAFYQSSDGKHYQMGCRKYASSRKFWEEFAAISRSEEDSEFPRVVADCRNILHLCYQKRQQKQYTLVYQQKVPDKNIWSGDVVIHTSAYPFSECSILCIEESVIIFWVRNDIIYYSVSNDSGDTWSNPSRYNFPSARQLICLSYKSNDFYENEKASVIDLPGVFVNGIKLAFYQNSVSSDANLSAEELKNTIVDSLKLLKGGIEELRETAEGMKEEILMLKHAQEGIERELTKYSVKQGMIENRIGESKLLDGKLESLRSALGRLEKRMDEISGAWSKPEKRPKQSFDADTGVDTGSGTGIEADIDACADSSISADVGMDTCAGSGIGADTDTESADTDTEASPDTDTDDGPNPDTCLNPDMDIDT